MGVLKHFKMAVIATILASELFAVQAQVKEKNTKNNECTETYTFTGNIDSDWTRPANWENNQLPVENCHLVINGTVDNLPWETWETNNLTITTLGDLNIESKGLTVNGDCTQNGVFDIGTGGSFIVKGVYDGNDIKYTRENLYQTRWYLIASPFNNLTIESIINSINLTQGSTINNITNLGLAFYDNDQNLPTSGSWIYQHGGSTGVIENAEGFAINWNRVGIEDRFNISGIPNQGNISKEIRKGSDNGFNLIGNPYPSYIPGNHIADDTLNILTYNSGILDELTLWLWQDSQNSYIPFNFATFSREYFIAPLQGFFVKIDSELNDAQFQFTEDMQNLGSGITDYFFRSPEEDGRADIEIKLQQTNENKYKKVNLIYLQNATSGFDNGYDSTIFDQNNVDFSFYSYLPSENEGKKYGIQSLSLKDLETTVIPLGISFNSNEILKITATSSSFEEGIKVYLEDKLTNQFIELSDPEFTEYEFNLSDEFNGQGRFFIHTTTEVLSDTSFQLSNVSIYQSNDNEITISGITNGECKFSLYDIHGRKIQENKLEESYFNHIAIGNKSKGLYIVSLETDKGKFNKKLILK